MMKFLTFAIVLLILITKAPAQNTKPKCGVLNERLTYKAASNAAPTEFPWIGHIRNVNNTLPKCLAVLISNRTMLAPAHCLVNYRKKSSTLRIHLGVWDESKNLTERACNRGGFCVPPPKEFNVSEIEIHPQYDKYTFNNNIAMLKLAKPVKNTPHIQPICMNNTGDPTPVVGKYFYVGGFELSGELKTKTTVIGISRTYCNYHHDDIIRYSTGSQFCAQQKLDDLLQAGSIAMAMNVVDDRPQNFYLIGLLVKADYVESGTPPVVSIFQDVSIYKDWIKVNLEKWEGTVSDENAIDIRALKGLSNF